MLKITEQVINCFMADDIIFEATAYFQKCIDKELEKPIESINCEYIDSLVNEILLLEKQS